MTFRVVVNKIAANIKPSLTNNRSFVATGKITSYLILVDILPPHRNVGGIL